MTVAEELTLLGLDPEGNQVGVGQTLPNTSASISMLLVVELVLAGHVELGDNLRIHLTGSRPVDPLLELELTCLTPFDGQRLGTCVRGVRHAGWRDALDALVTAGVVRRGRRWPRRDRHPVVDPHRHTALHTEVRAAALGDEPLDERMALLLIFSEAAGLPVLPRRHAPGRIPRVAKARTQMRLAAEVADLVPEMSRRTVAIVVEGV